MPTPAATAKGRTTSPEVYVAAPVGVAANEADGGSADGVEGEGFVEPFE